MIGIPDLVFFCTSMGLLFTVFVYRGFLDHVSDNCVRFCDYLSGIGVFYVVYSNMWLSLFLMGSAESNRSLSEYAHAEKTDTFIVRRPMF